MKRAIYFGALLNRLVFFTKWSEYFISYLNSYISDNSDVLSCLNCFNILISNIKEKNINYLIDSPLVRDNQLDIKFLDLVNSKLAEKKYEFRIYRSANRYLIGKLIKELDSEDISEIENESSGTFSSDSVFSTTSSCENDSQSSSDTEPVPPIPIVNKNSVYSQMISLGVLPNIESKVIIELQQMITEYTNDNILYGYYLFI